MTDNGPTGDSTQPRLTITLSQDGQLNVHGPLENKLLCYGMLEMAKQLIHVYQQPTITVPRLVMPTDLPRPS